jgi:hypothetical protein
MVNNWLINGGRNLFSCVEHLPLLSYILICSFIIHLFSQHILIEWLLFPGSVLIAENEEVEVFAPHIRKYNSGLSEKQSTCTCAHMKIILGNDMGYPKMKTE